MSSCAQFFFTRPISALMWASLGLSVSVGLTLAMFDLWPVTPSVTIDGLAYADSGSSLIVHGTAGPSDGCTHQSANVAMPFHDGRPVLDAEGEPEIDLIAGNLTGQGHTPGVHGYKSKMPLPDFLRPVALADAAAHGVVYRYQFRINYSCWPFGLRRLNTNSEWMSFPSGP